MKEGKNNIINGSKGVISIFLAALLVAFTVLSDSLVEVTRYHAVSNELEEIMDLSAISTLANYDDFLLNRFGLLAVDQKKEISEIYNPFFKDNLSGSKIAWEETGSIALGTCALSSTDVLKNQIMEFSKYSVPTHMAGSILGDGIDKIFSSFSSQSLSTIKKLSKAGSKCADTIGSMADLAETYEKNKQERENLDENCVEYRDKYQNFKSKIQNLIEAIKNSEASEQEYNNSINEYNRLSGEHVALSKEMEELNKEKKELGQKFEKLEISEEEYNKKIDEIDKTIENLELKQKGKGKEITVAQKSIDAANDAYKAAVADVQLKRNELDAALSAYKSIEKKVRDNVQNCIDFSETIASKWVSVGENAVGAASAINQAQNQIKYVNDDTVQKTNEQISEIKKKADAEMDPEKKQQLEDEKKQLEDKLKPAQDELSKRDSDVKNDQLVADSILEGVQAGYEHYMGGYNSTRAASCLHALNGLYEKLDRFSSASITKSFVCDDKEYFVEVNGLSSVEQINEALIKLDEGFNEETSDEHMSFWAFLSAVSSIIDSMSNISLVYNPKLDAVVQTAAFHNYSGGNSFSVSSFSGMAESTKNLSSLQNNKNMSTSSKLRRAQQSISGISAFLSGIEAVFASLTAMFSEAMYGMYRHVVIADYLNLTCSNRTTVDGSNVLTGYSFNNAGLGKSVNEIDAVAGFGAIAALINSISSGKNGNSQYFRGAEAEYIIGGTKSEIANQAIVFLYIYLIRMGMTIATLNDNPEVVAIRSAAAAFFKVGEIIISLIYVIAEPLLDTMVIVNGTELDFVKDCYYLTVSGAMTLVSHVVNWSFNNAQSGKMKEDLENGFIKKMKTKGVKYAAPEESGSSKDTDNLLKLGYSDYIWAFLCLLNEDTEIARFQDIVSMESKQKRRSFDLNKAYTYIEVVETGNYKPFLAPAYAYTEFVFDGTKRMSRGY